MEEQNQIGCANLDLTYMIRPDFFHTGCNGHNWMGENMLENNVSNGVENDLNLFVSFQAS